MAVFLLKAPGKNPVPWAAFVPRLVTPSSHLQSQQSGIRKYLFFARPPPSLPFHLPPLTLTLSLPLLRTLVITLGPPRCFKILFPISDPELNHTCKVPLKPEKATWSLVSEIRMWTTGRRYFTRSNIRSCISQTYFFVTFITISKIVFV